MISSVEVRTASSGHLRLTPTQVHGSCTSAPLTLTLRMAAVSQAAIHSAASPDSKSLKNPTPVLPQ